MKHLRPMFEKNRTARYYEENPDKLERFDVRDKGDFDYGDVNLALIRWYGGAKYSSPDSDWVEQRLRKDATAAGVDVESYRKALLWIMDFTSMSRKNLPKDVWPVLRKVTGVRADSLPEYLYRGLFYDGEKIPNKQEFLQRWTVGSKPDESSSRVASWSASKSVAIKFMGAQDFVKNKKDGYHVLIRWKVDPKKIIADMRNMEKYNDFYNQQEIIVEPVKDYEVVDIIEYVEGEYEDTATHRRVQKNVIPYEQYSNKNIKSQNGGVVGRTAKDMIADIFNVPFDDLKPGQKEQWKAMKDMTAKEVGEGLGASIHNNWPESDVHSACVLPLFTFVTKLYYAHGCGVVPLKSTGKTKTRCKFYLDIDGPLIAELCDKHGKTNFIDDNSDMIPEGDVHISGEGTLELVNNEALRYDFKLEFPKRYIADYNSGSSDKPTWFMDELVAMVNKNQNAVRDLMLAQFAKQIPNAKTVRIV